MEGEKLKSFAKAREDFQNFRLVSIEKLRAHISKKGPAVPFVPPTYLSHPPTRATFGEPVGALVLFEPEVPLGATHAPTPPVGVLVLFEPGTAK